MPTKEYKYSAVIGVSVNTKNTKKGISDTEKDLSRLEKKALKAQQQFEKLAKAIDAAEKANKAVSATKSVNKDSQRAAVDILKMQKDRVTMQTNANRAIEASEKSLTKIKISEVKARNKAELDHLKSIENARKRSNSASPIDFFAGSLASRAFTETIGLATRLASGMAELGVEAVKVGADFEQTRNSMIVFAGSAEHANRELAAVDETARKTTGLRLESAEAGYRQLRALGFEAENSRKLIAGLAKQRLLSGAQENDVQRVVVNLTQLSSGSSRASQDIKEIIHAMPSLRKEFALAFQTTDPKKIAKIFDKDAQAAITTLTDQLEKSKGASGGLNDSWGKLQDQILTIGRIFSEPILEPLTRSIDEMSNGLENSKNSWRDWGQFVGDIITGLEVKRNQGAERSAKYWVQQDKYQQMSFFESLKLRSNFQSTSDIPVSQAEIEQYLQKQNGGKNPLGMFEDIRALGEAERRKRSNIYGVSPSSLRKAVYGSADDANSEVLRLKREEKQRQDQLAKLDSFYAQIASVRENAFNLEVAQNKDNAAKVFALTKQNYQKEVAEITRFYNTKIALTDDTNEIYKVEVEKNNKLRDLRTKQAIDEINFLKEQNDKRRQNYLDFKALQEKEVSQFYDKQNYYIERGIERNVGINTDAYNQLIDLARKQSDAITEITKDEYATKLSDTSLTTQEIINLTKERDLTLADLAESSRRRILDIQDRQLQDQLQKFADFAKRQTDILNAQADSFGGLSSFFTNDNFDSNSFQAFRNAFFGGNIENEINRLQGRLELAKKEHERLKPIATYISGYTGAVGQAKERVDNLNDEIKFQQGLFADAQKNISPYAKEIYNLAEALRDGKAGLETFDKIAETVLINRQSNQLAALKIQITAAKNQFDIAKNFASDYYGRTDLTDAEKSRSEDFRKSLESMKPDASWSKEMIDAKQAIDLLQLSLTKLLSDQELEKLGFFRETTKGIAESIAKLRSGDPSTVKGLQDQAIKSILREQQGLLQENIYLQERLANVGSDSAERFANAWLNATLEVKEANIQAVEDQIRAQVRLADSATLHVDQIRAKVLDHLASQKTLNESIADGIVNLYEKAAGSIEKLLDKSIGKVPIIGDIAKAGARNLLTKITTGLLDKFLPSEFSDALKSTGNPVLDENKKQTNYLKKISDAVTGKSVTSAISSKSSGGSPGGGIFGMIRQVLGLGSSASTPPFNPSGGNFLANNPAGLPAYGGGIRAPWDVPNIGLNSNGGVKGNIFSNIKNLFSGKDGGIFAPRENLLGGGKSRLAGLIGGAGDLVSMVGGLVGGRAGGIMSSIGSFASMGASFGPWGAAIGAGIGAIVGILGGDPKRKADKKQNLPALQKGFAEAFAALKALASDKKALFNDPDGVVTQAKELKAQIAAGFGVEFQSKKYSKIAKQQIAQKVAEAEILVKQIEAEAAMQRNKKAKMESYVPTFADGGQISKFIGKAFQNNPLGYLTGPGTGRSDSILARVSNGEYVLDAETVKNIGLRRLDLLRLTKGRNVDSVFRSMNAGNVQFADGGAVGVQTPAAASTVSQPKVSVVNYIYLTETGATVETETYVDDRKLETKIENLIYRNGPDGKIPKALNNVKKG